MANINLSWTAPSTGGSVASYKIFRKAGTHASASTITSSSDSGFPVTEAASNGTTYQDSTATLGSTYSYTVVAANAAGDGPAATPASATA